MALLAPSSVMARPPRSVLVGKQNGDHALGHSWIGRIGRVVHQGRIEVIDLEKDRLSVGLKRPEIMFFVWVIGVTKIVIHRDGFDDALDSLLAKCSDAWSDHGGAAEQVLPELFVERGNGVCPVIQG